MTDKTSKAQADFAESYGRIVKNAVTYDEKAAAYALIEPAIDLAWQYSRPLVEGTKRVGTNAIDYENIGRACVAYQHANIAMRAENEILREREL